MDLVASPSGTGTPGGDSPSAGSPGVDGTLADPGTVTALATFATGLAKPVGLAHAPGDPQRRLFAVEQGGRIRVMSASGAVAASPYLDLSSRVSGGSEQGLLGIAFHPQFAANRRLFVNLTDTAGDTRVLEFVAPSVEAGAAGAATEREWLAQGQPFSNHNGGHLAFGPDGKLYIGLGDGGSANDPQGNAQNPQSRLGKMLRLDVDRVGSAPEILMRGLRNPWRYGFDRRTGDLYLGDVGQNRFEEIDVVPAGSLAGVNFGWAVVEGDGHCVGTTSCDQTGFVRPVLDYPTGTQGCSVVAGYVYRGPAIPELAGTFFYSDYCGAFLRSFRWDGTAAGDRRDWSAILDPDKKVTSVTTFGEDEAGELYVASHTGTVFKFVRKPGV